MRTGNFWTQNSEVFSHFRSCFLIHNWTVYFVNILIFKLNCQLCFWKYTKMLFNFSLPFDLYNCIIIFEKQFIKDRLHGLCNIIAIYIKNASFIPNIKISEIKLLALSCIPHSNYYWHTDIANCISPDFSKKQN